MVWLVNQLGGTGYKIGGSADERIHSRYYKFSTTEEELFVKKKPLEKNSF
jgi:hypothetical protein